MIPVKASPTKGGQGAAQSAFAVRTTKSWEVYVIFNDSKRSRRTVLKAGGALVAASALPRIGRAATNYPAIGTYPAGSSGSSVTIGIAVPRTGTYAVQGEDELKG